MQFFLCLLLAFATTSAMEAPLEDVPSEVRKYACCPEDFGYVYDHECIFTQGHEHISLCDFEETKSCSDDAVILVNNAFFERCINDLSTIATPQAKQSYAQLQDRWRTGRISVGQRTRLTHRDLCHRLFSHFPAVKEGADMRMIVQGFEIRFFFTTTQDQPSCIHKFSSFMYGYPSVQKEMLFGQTINQQFKRIRPFPSLVALAAQVVKKHCKKEALQIVPKDLKGLLN